MKARITGLEYISFSRLHIPSYFTEWQKCSSANFVSDANKGHSHSAMMISHSLSPSLLTSPWTSHDDLLAWSRVRRLSWQYERQQGGRRWVTGYRLWQPPSRGVLVSLRFPLPLPASRARGGQDGARGSGHRGGAGQGGVAHCGWSQGLGGDIKKVFLILAEN